jgi:ankyrin repeat protein
MRQPGLSLFSLILLVALGFLSACASDPKPSENLTVTQSSASTQPLIAAAEAGEFDRVKALVESGAPLNLVTEEGTPLTVAAASGHDRVAWYLLSKGADPNLMDGQNRTPLIAAAGEGSQRLVKLLLSAGANVNQRVGEGQTALTTAAMAGNLSVVRTLLDAGGNVNVARDGESLLMHVVRNGDLLMAEVLIGAGADAGYRAADGRTALGVARAQNNRDLEMLLVQSGGQ